jgi:hypothetical protein
MGPSFCITPGLPFAGPSGIPLLGFPGAGAGGAFGGKLFGSSVVSGAGS